MAPEKRFEREFCALLLTCKLQRYFLQFKQSASRTNQILSNTATGRAGRQVDYIWHHCHGRAGRQADCIRHPLTAKTFRRFLNACRTIGFLHDFCETAFLSFWGVNTHLAKCFSKALSYTSHVPAGSLPQPASDEFVHMGSLTKTRATGAGFLSVTRSGVLFLHIF